MRLRCQFLRSLKRSLTYPEPTHPIQFQFIQNAAASPGSISFVASPHPVGGKQTSAGNSQSQSNLATIYCIQWSMHAQHSVRVYRDPGRCQAPNLVVVSTDQMVTCVRHVFRVRTAGLPGKRRKSLSGNWFGNFERLLLSPGTLFKISGGFLSLPCETFQPQSQPSCLISSIAHHPNTNGVRIDVH